MFALEKCGRKDENNHFCCLPYPLPASPAQNSHNPASGRQWGRDFCYNLVSCLCLCLALENVQVWITTVPLLLPAALCTIIAEFREISQEPAQLRQPQGLMTKHFIVTVTGTSTLKKFIQVRVSTERYVYEKWLSVLVLDLSIENKEETLGQ